MIVLAILCLLVAAALIAFMLLVNPDQPLSYSFFAGNFATRPIWVFIAGAVTLLLIVLALDFFRRGTKRKVARRREIKQLRQQSASGPVVNRNAGTSHHTGTSHGQDSGHTEETYVRETRTDLTDRS